MKMEIKFLSFLSLVFLLVACGKKEPEWKNKISQATSVEIGIISSNAYQNQIIRMKDAKDVDVLKKMITDEEAAVANCGYSGAITYFKDTVNLISLKFSIDENCPHVAVDEDGKTILRKMTPEGLSYLKNLIRSATEPHLANLSWLEGTWVRHENNAESKEWWKKKDNAVIDGGSQTTQNGKVVFSEELKIEESDSGIFYIANVSENAGPVGFKLTQIKFQHVVFENPKHDWPQKITYTLTAPDSLLARVEGPVAD